MNNRCASTNSPPQRRGSFVSSALLIALGLCCSATPACGQAPTTEKLAAPSAPATLRRGEDWTQWRGPRSSGLALQTALPSTWPKEAPEPQLVVPLGEGWSSPIVAAGKVYVLDRKAELERVAAYDADTGKLVWERTNPVDFDPHQVGRRHGSGPKGTAAFADGFVYTVGIAGWMQCLKADSGELVWKHYFPEEFADPVPLPDGRAYVVGEDHVIVPISNGADGAKRGAQVPLFGYTGSPLVFGEFVVAATGGVRGGTITAFDLKTGKVAWHALHENVSYSSPVAAEIGGVKQVVVATGPRLVGLELATGKLLWDVPYQNQYDETIGTPVVAGDQVLLTAVGRPLTAWRVARDTAGAFAATELWRNEDFSSYLSSVIVVGDYVYGMNDGGEWNCAKLSDGKTIWRGGSHGYYTTPIVAENRILALNERGTLDIVAANPQKYEPIASLRLVKDATWSSPAIVADRVYIRSKSALLCFELK